MLFHRLLAETHSSTQFEVSIAFYYTDNTVQIYSTTFADLLILVPSFFFLVDYIAENNIQDDSSKHYKIYLRRSFY